MENLDLIIFNSILLLLSIWFILYVNLNFIYKTRINKKRFKLFALRDELSLLAMQGEVDYNSKEYQLVLNSLNGLIKITGDFKISDFLTYIVKNFDDRKNREVIEQTSQKLEKKNHALNDIWIQFSIVTNNIMSRHLRLFIMFLVSLAGILKSIKICSDFANLTAERGQRILYSSDTIKKIATSNASFMSS